MMKWHHWSLLLLLSVFVALSIVSAGKESLTFDEPVDVEEGLNALIRHTFAVDPYNPPLVKELTALPMLPGADRAFALDAPLSMRYGPGRFVTTLLAAVLIVAVYLVGAGTFGQSVGILSALFLSFEPTFLGHAHYITLDVGFSLFFFLAYVSFVKFINSPGRRRAVGFGLALGAALASKISAIPFFLVSALIFFLLEKKRMRTIQSYGWGLGLAGVTAALVIWATYFFRYDVVVAKHDDPSRVSSRIRSYAVSQNLTSLVVVVDWLQNRPIPLGNYLATVKNNVIRSSKPAKVFFLGELYESPRWYFMPVMFLIKTPLVLLVFFAFGTVTRTRGLVRFLVPVVAIAAVASLTRMLPLVRYVMPVYPFLAIVAANGAWRLLHQRYRVVVVGLIAWYVWGTIGAFPHFIAYANGASEFIGKKYELFMDSNLDWGQSLPDFDRYVRREKPTSLSFSYFGRDDASRYGLGSDRTYGSYKFEDICAFHEINFPDHRGQQITAISVSNWYYCGYRADSRFALDRVRELVGESILIF